MAYSDDIKNPSRQLLYKVEVILDRCNNVYGVSPCTATGGQCAYSWFTCEDRPNYVKTTRTYPFSSKDAPEIQSGDGVMPFLISVNPIMTEIDPKQSITIDSRVEMMFEDDKNPPPADHDKGAGKFLTARAGTFWKNLVQRNPNFKYRTVKLYEGLPAYASGDFQLKFQGLIENIEFTQDGKVQLTATDNMKRFKDIKIPNPISSTNVLTASATDSATTLSVTDGSQFKLLSNGYDSYAKCENEYFHFSNIIDNDLTGCVRGLFGTTASAHSASQKVIQVAPFASTADSGASADTGMNIVDSMKAITLGWVGMASGSVDSSTFDSERDIWAPNFKVRRIVEKPISADKLLSQLRLLSMSDIWQNESQKLTFRILHPTGPHETTTGLTAADNLISGSAYIDLNTEDHVTRVYVYYDPADTWGKDDSSKPEDFNSILIWVDTDAENANNYNEEKVLEVFAPWIFRESEAREFTSRYLRRYATPPAIYEFSLDRKDSALEVGDNADVTSSDFVDKNGANATKGFQVLSKRERRSGRVDIRCLETKLARKHGYIGHGTENDWPTATSEHKKHSYIGDTANNAMSDGEDGYYIF